MPAIGDAGTTYVWKPVKLGYEVSVQSWKCSSTVGTAALGSIHCPDTGYIPSSAATIELQGQAIGPYGDKVAAVIRLSPGSGIGGYCLKRSAEDGGKTKEQMVFDVVMPSSRLAEFRSMVSSDPVKVILGVDPRQMTTVLSVTVVAEGTRLLRSPTLSAGEDLAQSHMQPGAQDAASTKALRRVMTPDDIENDPRDLVPLMVWCKENGISRMTAYREINDGHLETTHIRGRVYLTKKNRQLYIGRKERAAKRSLR